MKCLFCNRDFEQTSKRQKYCDEKCRIKAKAKRVSKPSIKKNCKICNQEFEVSGRSRNSVFCSKHCKNKRTHIYKSCIICNETFFADPRSKCCSRKCASESLKRLDIKNCLICNEEFEVSPSKERIKYCSWECYSESRRTGQKSNCKCEICHKEFYKAPILQEQHEYNYCSRKCMAEHYQLRLTGENNPCYTGHTERHKKYYGPNWLEQRRSARKRDNYSCQTCGIPEDDYGQELSVHHIIPFIAFESYLEANELDNLTSLCEPCHRLAHTGENHPANYRDKYILKS